MSLNSQLKEYSEFLEEFQGELDASVIRQTAETVGAPSPIHRGPRRGWVIGVGVAVAVLVLFIPVFLLSGGSGGTPPATQIPVTTISDTVQEVPTTNEFSQLTLAEFDFDPADRPRLENQAEFVRYFSKPGSGGCTGPGGESYRGPYLCSVTFGPPLVSETVVIEIVVGDNQTTPGEPGSPDDRPMLTVAMSESRQLIEPILADLYNWALDTYPENTEAACGVGFTGDDEAIAWDPGYRADIPCGEHLMNHLAEFIENARP